MIFLLSSRTTDEGLSFIERSSGSNAGIKKPIRSKDFALDENNGLIPRE
jgi:hypothetical protein